jgi:hypothetical protein
VIERRAECAKAEDTVKIDHKKTVFVDHRRVLLQESAAGVGEKANTVSLVVDRSA